MGLGALVSGALGVGSKIFGSSAGQLLGSIGGSLLGADMSNKASAKQAKDQMQFQERMSSTAYQRAVADMRKAGLNPVLAASSPASTPGGAMGSVHNPNLGEALSKGVSSAIAVKQANANLRTLEANATRNEFDTWLVGEMQNYWETNPGMRDEILRSMWHQKAGQGQIGAVGGYIGQGLRDMSDATAAGFNTAKDYLSGKLNRTGSRIWNSAKRSYREQRTEYERAMYGNRKAAEKNASRVLAPRR